MSKEDTHYLLSADAAIWTGKREGQTATFPLMSTPETGYSTFYLQLDRKENNVQLNFSKI